MINTNLNYSYLEKTIVENIGHYFVKNHIHDVVLGISGGIDSTIVAILLQRIKEYLKSIYTFDLNTHGYSLPTNTTNKDELFISTLVGNTFCTHFTVDDITNITNNIDKYLNSYSLSNTFKTGNIKSRFRMIYLYNKAKEYNGVVIGTDNYTEKLLGFSTIGGDDTADIMPILNLWKTEVYKFAEHFLTQFEKEKNFAACHALQSSIQLDPQDGLGISSTDMDQLGANSYYEVDEILFDYLNGITENELVEKYSAPIVHNIISRYKCNFKLNLPITIKRTEIC
jgi:NAD+ synthase